MLALAIDQWRLAVAALAIVVTLVVAAHRTPIEGTLRAHAPSVGSPARVEALVVTSKACRAGLEHRAGPTDFASDAQRPGRVPVGLEATTG